MNDWELSLPTRSEVVDDEETGGIPEGTPLLAAPPLLAEAAVAGAVVAAVGALCQLVISWLTK